MHEFHAGTAHLESLIDAFVTLIPKEQAPEAVGDFRPISLTSVVLKFLTKLLQIGFKRRSPNVFTRTNMVSSSQEQFKIVLHGLLSTFISAINQISPSFCLS